MINILTIYKFNFPFLFNKFEEVKYKAIVSDMKQLLLYNDIFISNNIEKNKIYEINEFVFSGGKIIFTYYYENSDYFIPQFKLDLYFSEKNIIKFNEGILNDLIKIFESIGLDEYIFEATGFKNIYSNFNNIILINDLEDNFKNYNYSDLEKFLKITNNDYIDIKIKENKIIKYSFYYMIFICYLYFRNKFNSSKNIKEVNNLLIYKKSDIYKGNLELSKDRLKYLNKLNDSYFKKYKKMLDDLFNLLK